MPFYLARGSVARGQTLFITGTIYFSSSSFSKIPKAWFCVCCCSHPHRHRGMSTPLAWERGTRLHTFYQEEKWLLGRLPNWPLCQWLALLWQVKFTFAPPSVSTKRQGSKYSSEQVLLWDSGLGVEDVCRVWAPGGGVGNTRTEAIEKSWDSVWRSPQLAALPSDSKH